MKIRKKMGWHASAALAALNVVTGTAVRGDEFRLTLTDTASNTWLEEAVVDGTKVEAAGDGDWSVRKFTLRGGRQEGVDVVEVNNGVMSFTVVPTRGMNVHRVECGDVTLGWNSPVRELVNPAFINPADRGGLGWLEGFNEWMARCGYEFAGHPGEDGEKMLTLHGKASNTPASKVEVIVKDKRIHVRGTVVEAMFKFSHLEMVTDISTEIGSRTVRFEDTLTNRGSNVQEYAIIYHSNYGEPLLEAGSKFVAPVRSVRPFDARAAEELAGHADFGAPTKGYGETVFCMTMNAGADGKTTVMLRNAAADRGVAMRYGVASLPHFTLWKNTDVGEKGYVTGLEPGSGYPYNRAVERARGRLATLQSGEARRFDLEVEVLGEAARVAETAAAIATLQGGKATEVLAEPEK